MSDAGNEHSETAPMSSEQLAWTIYESPFGPLTLVASRAGIRSVYFPGRSSLLAPTARRRMQRAEEQLAGYFAGERRGLELGLDLRGAPLQQLVWERLLQIPYGTTTTYGELAGRIDASLYPPGLEPYQRARLVGSAIAATPAPILVPCHRVIGADGSLTGYGGGLQRKRWLLELEDAGAGARLAEPAWAERQLALL